MNLDATDLDIIQEEENYLKHLLANYSEAVPNLRYDSILQQIYDLRNSIQDEQRQDLPQITEQITRLSSILNQTDHNSYGTINLQSPYFAHMRLQQGPETKDFFIGSYVYCSQDHQIQIIDWKTSPISIIYYRYDEGEEYEEKIAGRWIEGEVIFKRAIKIFAAQVQRIIHHNTTYFRNEYNQWQKQENLIRSLAGGSGSAIRATSFQNQQCHFGNSSQNNEKRHNKHLPEIAGLLDAEQYRLITKADHGVTAIQGMAGSGKTTVALHRVAWLHSQDPTYYAANKMMVMVFNKALANYISQLLPSLNVHQVKIEYLEEWLPFTRIRMLEKLLPINHSPFTPPEVIKLKKHPMMLKIIDQYIQQIYQNIKQEIKVEISSQTFQQIPWEEFDEKPVITTLFSLVHWIQGKQLLNQQPFPGKISETVICLRIIEQKIDVTLTKEENLVLWWEDLFSDSTYLTQQFTTTAALDFSEKTLENIMQWCRQQYILRQEGEHHRKKYQSLKEYIKAREASQVLQEEGFTDIDDYIDQNENNPLFEAKAIKQELNRDTPCIDFEDNPILLYMYQKLIGNLKNDQQQFFAWHHLVIDEAQDLCPLELKLLYNCTVQPVSITLAGDLNQKIMRHNSICTWQEVFQITKIPIQEQALLQVPYRSTAPIMQFAFRVLGEQAANSNNLTTLRDGAPVECFQFNAQGELIYDLQESLKKLYQQERYASVALICIDDEAAISYFKLLKQYQIPKLRLVIDQNFSFQPGIDLTEIQQVKGLEFDYVILLDVDTVNYPLNTYSRYLLHVAATRAIHQLWIMNYRKTSLLIN